jgi:hypothetical protein
VTECPKCRVRYEVWREQQLVRRAGCRRHRTETPPPDPDAVTRLRRAWTSSQPTYSIIRPALTTGERAAAADLRDDQRAQRDESPDPWRSDVPLEAVTSEDRLIAALHLPELVAEAA